MKADATTEAAVKSVMEKFNQGYVVRDMDMIMSTFADDADVMIWGTGADEKRVGKAAIEEQVRRDWSQAESTAILFNWTLVSAAGSVAWVASDMTFAVTTEGLNVTFGCRGTFVFEKRGNDWLVVHAHFSFPASEQEEGESFPE